MSHHNHNNNTKINGSSHHKYKREHYTRRDETPLETALESTWDEAQPLLKKIPLTVNPASFQYQPSLQSPIFCGHLVADLDSIAGAIGASVLYNGTPARASEVNAETQFALNYWKCKTPEYIVDLLAKDPHRNVCLVDFQQKSQLHEAIPQSSIVGIIDHHALQSSTIITERPIFVDIRPWGSVCTILAHLFALHEQYLPIPVAGMMLSGILSDTLNLKSPTTTSWDERMVSMLVQFTGLDDVNMFAASQFRAKSRELSHMSPYALVHGDSKLFQFDSSDGRETYKIGYSVIETTDAEASLQRGDELISELKIAREERDLTAMLLAIVDIVNMNSILLISGVVEESLATAAYGETMNLENHCMALPNRVSRKKDFIPPLARAIQRDGWAPPRVLCSEKKRSSIVMSYSDFANGQPVRILDEDENEPTNKTGEISINK